MSDEDVREAQEPARRQGGNVAQVEQQRAALVAKRDIKRRVAERVVHQAWIEQAHASPASIFFSRESLIFARSADRVRLAEVGNQPCTSHCRVLISPALR